MCSRPVTFGGGSNMVKMEPESAPYFAHFSSIADGSYAFANSFAPAAAPAVNSTSSLIP